MTYCELCDSPPYFQHLLAPTNHPIYKEMLINQVLVDSVLRTNYLIIILTHMSLVTCGSYEESIPTKNLQPSSNGVPSDPLAR